MLEMTIVWIQLLLHLDMTPVCMTWVTRGAHTKLTVKTTDGMEPFRTEMKMVVRVTFGTDTTTLRTCTTALEMVPCEIVVRVFMIEL